MQKIQSIGKVASCANHHNFTYEIIRTIMKMILETKIKIGNVVPLGH